MRRAISIVKEWAGPVADVLVLDYESRHRRRVLLKGASGLDVLLDLAEVPDLREGDCLELASGAKVRVQAAAEPLMEVRCRDPHHLARVAYHIGNRHIPAEIRESTIRLRSDHVIADMVQCLGAQIVLVNAPFNPEGGAYGIGAVHGHD
jgi:urease accessory protein